MGSSGGSTLNPFSHLGSLKGRDPKSTGLASPLPGSQQRGPHPPTPRPSTAQLSAPQGGPALPGGGIWPRHLCLRFLWQSRTSLTPGQPRNTLGSTQVALLSWGRAPSSSAAPALAPGRNTLPPSQGAAKALLQGWRSRRGGEIREGRRREKTALLLSAKKL